MATELDALQLNITASTSGAERSIERLATKLQSLSNAIGAFNSSGFQQIAGNIVQSLNDIKTIADGTDTTSLKNIASGIRSLASATKNLSDGNNVKTYLNNVASGLNSIASVSVDLSGITNMMNSMNRLGSGGNIQNAGEYLQRVATGISAFQGITIPNLTGIAEFTAALRSLGSRSLGAAGANLQSLVPQLMQLQGLSLGNVTGLNDLAQALSVFGRATSQRALDSSSITRFATAYRQLVVTLSTAPGVSQNVIDLTNALARFLQGLNSVPRASTQASRGLHLFGNAAAGTQKKLVSLAAIIGKIYATYFLLFRAFRLLKKGIDIASDLKEVQNVVDTTFGDMTDKVEEFSKEAVEKFGMSELSAKKYASRFQAMGTAMGLSGKQVENAQKKLNKINPELAARGYSDTADSVADMSINITKLTGDMASFYNVAQEDVAKDLESIWTGQTRPLRAYGLDLTNATLQEWAMKNGIDANVKSMSQAEKTLLRYQYVMANTSAVQGDFAKTSLTWANQTRILVEYFKQLGSVIGKGFIAWLRPMVVTINSYMDSIIAAVQRVVNALGQIFGWQMIVDTTGDVAEDVEDIADAYDDATGAAKKFKQQLLGIDELNNLTTNDNGGGGADAGGVGYGGTNIIQPGGIDFVPYESDIKTLYDLGDRFSEAIRNLLPDDWTPIYEKVRGFGTGLADFLNGLINPDTFYKVGQSIAGAINSLGEFLWSFIKNADWKKYKDSFIALLEGFFSEIKLKNVAIIIGAITIAKVAKWVLSGAALKGLATAIGTGISGIFSGATSGGFLSGIAGVFSSMSTGAIIASGAIGILVTGLAAVFATNEEVRASFMESISSITSALIPAIQFIGDTVIPNLVAGFQGLLDILSPLGEFLVNVFTSIWQDMINPVLKDVGENILPPLVNILQSLWTGVLVPLGTFLGGVFKPIIDLLATVLNNLWSNIVVPIFQGVWSVVQPALELVMTLIQGLIDEFIAPLVEAISVLWEASLKPLLEWLVNTLKPIVNTVFTFIGDDLIGGLFQSLSGLIEFITGVFTGDWERAWNGVSDIFFGIFNACIGFLEGIINLMIDLLNGIFSGINWATSGVGELLDTDLSIPLIEHVHLDRFEMGGFPDQGSLFVAGETYGQSEWVGDINGRTGVTSGREITGIADAIYSTSEQEIALLRTQNEYLSGILQKEFGISQKEVGNAARNYARDFYNRTGKEAYSF